MESVDLEISIRPAGTDDIGWIAALVPRLHEFGPPPGVRWPPSTLPALRWGSSRCVPTGITLRTEEAGYPWLTLHVFEGNDRARRLYEQTGYVVEWTRMLKPVGPRRRT